MGEDSHDKTKTADYRLQTLQTVQFFCLLFLKLWFSLLLLFGNIETATHQTPKMYWHSKRGWFVVYYRLSFSKNQFPEKFFDFHLTTTFLYLMLPRGLCWVKLSSHRI